MAKDVQKDNEDDANNDAVPKIVLPNIAKLEVDYIA